MKDEDESWEDTFVERQFMYSHLFMVNTSLTIYKYMYFMFYVMYDASTIYVDNFAPYFI